MYLFLKNKRCHKKIKFKYFHYNAHYEKNYTDFLKI